MKRYEMSGRELFTHENENGSWVKYVDVKKYIEAPKEGTVTEMIKESLLQQALDTQQIVTQLGLNVALGKDDSVKVKYEKLLAVMERIASGEWAGDVRMLKLVNKTLAECEGEDERN